MENDDDDADSSIFGKLILVLVLTLINAFCYVRTCSYCCEQI